MANNAFQPKYNFLFQPEEELICVICVEVAEEPWQHADCGRLLCSNCLRTLGDNPCPYCEKQKPLFFPDNQGKFLSLNKNCLFILALSVRITFTAV